MANKTIKTRIVNKHDTSTNWSRAVNFIPKADMIKELKSIEQGNKSKLKVKLEKSVLNNILETFKEI